MRRRTTGTVRADRGAALVVSLIMLALVTLMVIVAMNVGSSNFKVVSNTQYRDEAVAAAELAIQQVVSTPFTDDPQAEEILVDINHDDTDDYVVGIAEPECIFAGPAEAAEASSAALPVAMSTASTWNTVWQLEATVTPAENTGQAAVRLRSGVRVLLTEVEKNSVCP